MHDAILYSQKHHVGVITLNRPSALNALNAWMISSLQHQLQVWQEDSSVHAVVVCAAPGRAFCAGGDVRFIHALKQTDHQAQLDFFKAEYRLNQFIYDYPKPYIALMDGLTMGGGVGISLHGSHPIAGERFSFAMPETGIGFFPDIGSSYLLTRCPFGIGTYLGLTGARLNANEARSLGLVKALIPSHQFSVFFDALVASDLSSNAAGVVDHMLASFMSVEDEQKLEQNNTLASSPIESCFQRPDLESIIDGLAMWPDKEWHHSTLQTLGKKSPLSLKVTLAQLNKAQGLSMQACLEMDYGLTGHFLRDDDFYEGVRALLLDKDNAPRWNPSTLEDVTDAMVLRYFS